MATAGSVEEASDCDVDDDVDAARLRIAALKGRTQPGIGQSCRLLLTAVQGVLFQTPGQHPERFELQSGLIRRSAGADTQPARKLIEFHEINTLFFAASTHFEAGK